MKNTRQSRRHRLRLLALAGISAGLLTSTALGAAAPTLASLSFEELGSIEVTTASKRSESLFNTAAAITVVTGDEIHQRGAESIPAALRGVTGLSVSQINGSTWGIGGRGFASQFATKLLVMIDGRSVYTPVFGGVFWDAQDTFIDDIDRMEVVLGSNGALWGANAVNGVINILTRNARDTQGGLAYGGVDDSGHVQAGVRQGWRAGRQTFARAYFKYRSTCSTLLPSGDPAEDATRFFQSGFRIDGGADKSAGWTFQGDAYRGWNDFRVTMPTLDAPPSYLRTDASGEDIQGANLLGRMVKTFSTGSTLRWQAWLDHNERTGPIFDVRVQTAEAEMQHSLELAGRHQIDWGLSARYTAISTHDRWIAFVPTDSHSTLGSIFAQDRFSLLPDKLAISAGIKLENSSNSGFEPQPSLKISWLPGLRHSLWAGWARSVRTPAYTELANRTDAAVVPGSGLPRAIRGIGNPDLGAERLHAADAGWRWRLSERFNATLTGFHNEYTELIKVTSGTPYVQATPTTALIIPLPQDNGMAGRVYGGEFSARWQVQKNWRVDAGIAHAHVKLWAKTPDPFNFTANARSSPRNTASLAATFEIPAAWELLAAVRYVDEVRRYAIPAYVECDLRLSWHFRPGAEITLVGSNLLDNQHPELNPSLVGRASEIPRSFLLKLTWRR